MKLTNIFLIGLVIVLSIMLTLKECSYRKLQSNISQDDKVVYKIDTFIKTIPLAAPVKYIPFIQYKEIYKYKYRNTLPTNKDSLELKYSDEINKFKSVIKSLNDSLQAVDTSKLITLLGKYENIYTDSTKYYTAKYKITSYGVLLNQSMISDVNIKYSDTIIVNKPILRQYKPKKYYVGISIPVSINNSVNENNSINMVGTVRGEAGFNISNISLGIYSEYRNKLQLGLAMRYSF